MAGVMEYAARAQLSCATQRRCKAEVPRTRTDPAAAVAASSAGGRLHAPRARLAAGLGEAGAAICPANAIERASTAWISA